MFAFAPLNEELFNIVATRVTYLKLFEHLFEDFVTRKDMDDLLKPQNIKVVIPATSSPGSPSDGGVSVVLLNPARGATPSAQGLKAKLDLEKDLTDVDPTKFIGS